MNFFPARKERRCIIRGVGHFIVLAGMLFLPFFCAALPAQVVSVPGDYSTIQEAIDSVTGGFEIIVSPGVYQERINFRGKNIIVRSTDPNNLEVVAGTVIDGTESGSVVTFSGDETSDCILSGFTIVNGKSSYGGGIHGNKTKATIQNNVIKGNTASKNGGGLFECNGKIYNNVICRNSASEYGGGIYSCDGSVINNTIFDNSAGSKGGGISGCWGTIRNCIVWNNTSSSNPQVHDSVNPAYCCIEDWAGGGTGNISENPSLVDPDSNDFHLGDGSPCIDAGGLVPDLTVDFEGHIRGFNAVTDSRGDGSDYDIGVDEYRSGQIYVPQHYPTIQSAIDISLGGEEIIVSPGTYDENIDFGGKNLVLRSTDPTDWNVVENTILTGRVTFSGTETVNCQISGFVITKGGIRGDGTFATIQYNYIYNNGDYRGGIYNCQGDIRFNKIENNRVGLYLCNGLIEYNKIENNGDYYNHNEGGGLKECNGTIQYNIISGNKVRFSITPSPIPWLPAIYSSGYGGGLYKCNGLIQGNIISNNVAEGSSSSYVASLGAGLAYCNGTIKNNMIIGNTVTYGHGGALYQCDGTILNNTIYGNSVSHSGAGLAWCDGTVRNCIVWGNTGSFDVQIREGSPPSYSCIQDWTGGGEGNITDDPLFSDPDNADFHLQESSPCIDAGGAVGLYEDFEGDPRPFDGTSEPRGDGSDIDIGADEFAVPDILYTFDDTEEGWTYHTIDHPLFAPAEGSREELVEGDWALGIESDDTANSGNWIDDGCVRYGAWYSLFETEYEKNTLYRTRWHVRSTRPVEAHHPPLRFIYTTPHGAYAGSRLYQPGYDGQFPHIPSNDLNNLSIIDHYFKPSGYIMNRIHTDPKWEEMRGMGLCFDLVDESALQAAKLQVSQVDVYTMDIPGGWVTLKSMPPFKGGGWSSQVYGDGVSLTNETDYLKTTFSSIGREAFRMGLWSTKVDAAVELKEETLYRVECTLTSTYTNLPTIRFRVYTSHADNVAMGVLNVDDGQGGKIIDGISVPGSTARTFHTYFYSGKIIPGDKLYFSLDVYDCFGYASGTYYLRGVKIQEAQ